MEKEQIKEAYKIVDLDIQHENVGEINSEQYYQETYENESWYHHVHGDKLSPQTKMLPLYGQAKRLPKLFC